jgi:AbrB family looped-hinge helix DNA binding protein
MKLLQIQKKNQLTLPSDVRKQLNLKEYDILSIEVKDNKIILTPQKVVDREQEWFWTERWQEGEKKAEEDLKTGRYKEFNNIDDLIKDLNDENTED